MIIANPIYDVVFKKLMEDKKIAKFFIETLINEELFDVTFQPQEYTYQNHPMGLALFRYDFIASIKTKDGQFKKVLIEIQKGKNPIDILRFRQYLAEQYRREDEITIDENTKINKCLPIITIYLLGFTINEIDSAAVHVNRVYKDLINDKIIKQKSEFVEQLSHDCFVVQLPRIKVKLRNRLEKLLSIIEQDNFLNNDTIIKDYEYPIDDENIKQIVDVLYYSGSDYKTRREIELEQEAVRVLELATNELKIKLNKVRMELVKKEQKLELKNKKIEEKDSKLKEKDNKLKEKDSKLKEKDSELKEKDSELKEKDSMLKEKDTELKENQIRLKEQEKLIKDLKNQLNKKN